MSPVSTPPSTTAPTAGRHVAIVGSTASGKSSLALAIAAASGDWEVVSVDSMQVYRGMDVGTAKATASEREAVPHHLIDIAAPDEDFDLATYQSQALAAIADIEARGRRALLVGGTALYVRAVVDRLDLPGQYPAVRAELDAQEDTRGLHARLAALDPEAASRMEPTNRRRIVRALEVTLGAGRAFSSFGPGLDTHPPSPIRLLGVGWDRTMLDRRIDERLDAQMEAGFVDEVRSLLAAGGLSRSAGQALGYKELAEAMSSGASLDDAVALTRQRTRQFSRRQDKWFRRDPRIQWLRGAAGIDAITPSAIRLIERERGWGPHGDG